MGKVHVFGDNIDTDVIIPARYLNTSEPSALAKHCMVDADPTFIGRVARGDIIVAGRNFGCGSSREHAPVAIKASGVSCVIAISFARIFLRNAINVGLPVIELDLSMAGLMVGDDLDVNFKSGVVLSRRTRQSWSFRAFPPFIQEVIAAGGLMAYEASRKVGTARKEEATRS